VLSEVSQRIARSEVIVLVKVKKRSEEFDKAKLKASLKKAGAKESHARRVADKIARKVKNGTRTVEIWEWVIAELKPLDPKAAIAYRTYRSKMKKKRKR
jgi:transcriptional regulator NrdR family protein